MRDGRRTEASGERRGGDGCARVDYNVFCLYRHRVLYQLIENLYRHAPALGVPAPPPPHTRASLPLPALKLWDSCVGLLGPAVVGFLGGPPRKHPLAALPGES